MQPGHVVPQEERLQLGTGQSRAQGRARPKAEPGTEGRAGQGADPDRGQSWAQRAELGTEELAEFVVLKVRLHPSSSCPTRLSPLPALGLLSHW